MKLKMDRTVTTACQLVDFIAQHTDLSKSSVKKTLDFGGGWIKQAGSKLQRCRRATKPLAPGDQVTFYFDDQLYLAPITPPECIKETRHWGLWFKPVNMPTQGTTYGDLNCLEHQINLLKAGAKTHLINRLDKEASGLVLVAYHREAAAKLSALWQTHSVEKRYQAEVHGHLTDTAGRIDAPLDEKTALTEYQVHKTQIRSSLVTVKLHTGRYHQIRRHFSLIDHPLLGDPLYAKGFPSDTRGLQLVATHLSFLCPLTHQPIQVDLPADKRLF